VRFVLSFRIITGKPFLAYLAGYVHAWTFHTWAIQHSVRLGPLDSYTDSLHTMRREALEQVVRAWGRSRCLTIPSSETHTATHTHTHTHTLGCACARAAAVRRRRGSPSMPAQPPMPAPRPSASPSDSTLLTSTCGGAPPSGPTLRPTPLAPTTPRPPPAPRLWVG
jgi:hypothetical protein